MRRVIIASASAAAVAVAAAAESWGTTGSWELVAAIGSGPQGSQWHATAATGGCVYVTGGRPGGGGNATFQVRRRVAPPLLRRHRTSTRGGPP